ncbi:hypothetical protein [Novosphingobium sp.]|uniref:DUF7064 domain-containing protein n=1 Tax=Novosphingobium sp. TaxID=1874826 RepID=UPI00260229E0|nr:hypothetical protein [Novosphingobium sp.]
MSAGAAPTSSFGPADELPHEPGPDSIWQESYWIYFGDGKGLGGGIHTGEQVNLGLANIFALCHAGGRAFRRAKDDFDLDRAMRASNRYSAGPYVFTPGPDGTFHLDCKDDDFSLELDFTPQSGDLTKLTVFPDVVNHIGSKTSSINTQAPGRVRGIMVLGDRSFDFDAPAQQGHSWGNRDYHALRGHGSRWITGSVGDRLNFSAYVAIRGDGLIIRSGFVVDNGRVEHTSDIQVIVEADLDGITYRGGTVRMKYPDREYVFRCRIDSINLIQHHGSEINVGVGDLRVDGLTQTGYSAWEINERPPTPAGGVPFSLGSHVVDGLITGA